MSQCDTRKYRNKNNVVDPTISRHIMVGIVVDMISAFGTMTEAQESQLDELQIMVKFKSVLLGCGRILREGAGGLRIFFCHSVFSKYNEKLGANIQMA